MKSLNYKIIAAVFALFLLSGFTFWGFDAHKTINRKAIYLLPPGMFGFYKKHIRYLEEHAIDPDKRRHSVEGEDVKHYIDIDHFASPGEDPFAVMPEKWNDAVKKFSEDTIRAYGILPWNVQWVMKNLTEAFREKDKHRILQLSADLGHYIADAHVPLHTTENYNGQMTGQEGIHAFWESRMIELYLDSYDLLAPKAHYIPNVGDEIWRIIADSHSKVDLVLDAETEAGKTVPDDKKYVYDKKGGNDQQIQSELYSKAFHENLDGMVEEQLRKSISDVASFWYTAWVNAGQPQLD